jgi:ATP phosphoribosyltransferase regulatory subunit
MSKFEEYDLYVKNKEFLVSDSVITFTDTNGRLMALKPDVTLSIVKNTKEHCGTVQRLYYDENVYRVSASTRAYKEIMQAGLECIGDVGTLELSEVIGLAAQSLALISEESLLTISHLGIVSDLISREEIYEDRKELLTYIGERNSQGIVRLCERCNAPRELKEQILGLISAYGPAKTVLPGLLEQNWGAEARIALEELAAVTQTLEEAWGISVCIDLSLVSNMNYYNGFMFRGFVKGIPTSVLNGGQYDNLMKRMGKSSKAVGFAVYLDLLERMGDADELDADVLLLYGKGDPADDVLRCAEKIRAAGESVSVQQRIPEKMHYGRLVQFSQVYEVGELNG